MSSNGKLDVLISTYGVEGLQRVTKMNLPQVEGVRYVVSLQNPENKLIEIPELLTRPDVLISIINSKGLSKNRNNAISLSEADVCLIADDDLQYTEQQLLAVLETFRSQPNVDVAMFKYDGDNKLYPDKVVNLSEGMPKNYYPSSVEIAFRRSSLLAKGIKFNENFGINARYGCCEDPLFLHDCIDAGLNCVFFPITITTHNGVSTGNRPVMRPDLPEAHGAYIRRVYGFSGILRVPLFAWRNHRAGRLRFWWGLRYLLKGFLANPASR